MTINQAIQDAIKQNLPAAVAGELSIFIDQANKAANELGITKQKLADVNKDKSLALEDVQKLEAKLKAYTDLESREKAVEEKENKLAVIIADINRDRALDTVGKIYALAEIAFRNPRLVHTENGYLPVAIAGQSYPGSGNFSKTIETTETK